MTAYPGRYSAFRDFATHEVAPYASQWDEAGQVSPHFVDALAKAGFLGAAVPRSLGGTEFSAVELGLLCAALGQECSSARSLITVHSMVCNALARWGSPDLRKTWLPRLAVGSAIGAFALSEPEAGSDTAAIQCRAVLEDQTYVLSGAKRWITFGQRADVFLCFAQSGEGPVALLVPAQSGGVKITPMPGLLGIRASMTAAIEFCDVRVPACNVIGRPGFGLSAVAYSALELGRLSVAFGCLGMLEACVTGALAHARQRRTFGKRLIEHQLIASILSKMFTDRRAAFHLCLSAAEACDADMPAASRLIWTAKYFASTAASSAASQFVQVMGARGFESDASSQRLMRDAKVMEVIEGSTQLQEITIAQLLDSDFHEATLEAELRAGPVAETVKRAS